jgi:hypothetical protein
LNALRLLTTFFKLSAGVFNAFMWSLTHAIVLHFAGHFGAASADCVAPSMAAHATKTAAQKNLTFMLFPPHGVTTHQVTSASDYYSWCGRLG